MKRRLVWSIAAAFVLVVGGLVGFRGDGGPTMVAADGVDETISSTSIPTGSDAAVVVASTSITTTTTTNPSSPTTSLVTSRSAPVTPTTVPRSASQPTTVATQPGPNATTTNTQPKRWVTVATLSHGFHDGGGWHDTGRFDLVTGKARFVIDAFEVGNENAQLNWHIMGDEPYQSVARGQCEGPATSTPSSGYPPTTANPSPTGPPCNSAYEKAFEIPSGNYYLRVGSTHSKWTVRVQEFR